MICLIVNKATCLPLNNPVYGHTKANFLVHSRTNPIVHRRTTLFTDAQTQNLYPHSHKERCLHVDSLSIHAQESNFCSGMRKIPCLRSDRESDFVVHRTRSLFTCKQIYSFCLLIQNPSNLSLIPSLKRCIEKIMKP